ncbi:XK-related protein 7-like [Oncorhynchus keta]|uniref:XK-related protein 7-like n=1 Tax=Oncorhynchus keta TaxID=8018 RepID=UPI00227AD60F|nr:XK-related protein 7-like [Oncorhynchus keta]
MHAFTHIRDPLLPSIISPSPLPTLFSTTNMAAKSDGAPVSLQNDILPEGLPGSDQRSPQCHPDRKRYSLHDCSWTLCALLVFFSDGASDLWLAADYYLSRNYWWFALTLVFVIVPSVVVQVLSFRWFAYDYSDNNDSSTAAAAVAASCAESHFTTKDSDQTGAGRDAEFGKLPTTGTMGGARGCCRACMWLFQCFIHIFQLAQVWRYVHALYLGVQSRWRGDHERRHFYWRMMFESADISMLRLLESFLKSAPQLVLQLSIMVQASQVLPLQGLSASASLVSLSWMIASYQKVLRDSRDDKLPMSYKAVSVQILWHLFTIGARTMAFALFASVFQLYFGIFIVAHWCIMTFWIIQGETDFCMSKWEEVIYNMMVGIVYVFCWFSVREGRTRCRMLIYSVVVFIENVALTTFWYVYRGPHTSDFSALIIVCMVASSYALGTFFMLVYYCLLHPDGPISGWLWGVPEEIAVESCLSPASSLPPDVVASPPRTLQRTKGGDREQMGGANADVFLVRTLKRGAKPNLPPLIPRTEGPVIRIDLPRKKYPAWDAHFIDRRLRKTILVLEAAAPVTPRIQYRCLGSATEVMEYETTV